MFERVKLSWKILTGKTYLSPPSKTIYVHSSKPESTLVQLVPWRDHLLALDESGKVWRVNDGYDGFMYIEFLMDSPRGY